MERVARVKAARDAIERQRLIEAHQNEAFRQEQVRDCEDRKRARFNNISEHRAIHNKHVKNAVTSTRRREEFEQLRRIADIEAEEARSMIRKEQQQRMRDRLRDQIRAAQHLDLEAQEVMQKGTVTLGQNLEKLRVAAQKTSPERVLHQGATTTIDALHQQHALEETQHALMRLAQVEAKLEKQWKSLT